MRAYLLFELRRMLRSRRYLLITIGFPVLFYILFSRSDGRLGATQPFQGTTWGTYYLASMIAFAAITASLNVGGARLAAERTSGWVRSLRVTALPPWGYLTVKLAAALVLTLPTMIAVCLVGAATGHVHLSAGAWVALVGFMWIGSLAFAALSLAIGMVATSDTAQPLTSVVLLVLSFFGGLFEPVSALPSALRDLADALPTYHLGHLGWMVVEHRPMSVYDYPVLLAWGLAGGAVVAWRYRSERGRTPA